MWGFSENYSTQQAKVIAKPCPAQDKTGPDCGQAAPVRATSRMANVAIRGENAFSKSEDHRNRRKRQASSKCGIFRKSRMQNPLHFTVQGILRKGFETVGTE